MMSDLVKAQNLPQLNWYTHWTSLGANGMPDKLIKEGLKQPNQIKIFFEKNSKEITGHVAPDQAWFGMEYFLEYTLPNFKSKILTWLLDMQKDNGPLLFSLMDQCFQDVGLTKWTSIVAKQCPNKADHTKSNFNKCICDYLKAVASFPNIGNQLIFWLRMARSPHSCQCTNSRGIRCSFSATLRVAISVKQWTYPWRKRRVSKSSLHSLRRTRTSSPTWTRRCLLTRSRWLLSLSSAKQPTRQLAFLRRLPRTRSSQRKGKRLIFLPRVAMNQATVNIAVTNTTITIKATDAIATITDLTIIIKTIDAMIVVNAMTRTQRATSPTTRRMIASVITPRKRVTRPWIMTGTLCSVPAIHLEEGVDLVQDHLFHSHSPSRSRSSSRSYDNHHVDQDYCKPSVAPKHRYLYSEDNDGGHYHHPDKNNTILPPSLLWRQKKRTQK